AEPFVLERGELLEVLVRLDLSERIELQLPLLLEPEGAPRRLVEVPRHGFGRVGVERLACSARCGREFSVGCHARRTPRSCGWSLDRRNIVRSAEPTGHGIHLTIPKRCCRNNRQPTPRPPWKSACAPKKVQQTEPTSGS